MASAAPIRVLAELSIASPNTRPAAIPAQTTNRHCSPARIQRRVAGLGMLNQGRGGILRFLPVHSQSRQLLCHEPPGAAPCGDKERFIEALLGGAPGQQQNVQVRVEVPEEREFAVDLELPVARISGIIVVIPIAVAAAS